MTKRDDVIAACPSFSGYTYRLAPPPTLASGTIDCSLFVVEDFKAAGVPFAAGVRTAEQIRQVCEVIPFDQVLPADLLFFEDTYDAGPPSADGHIASHVGISLGTGTFEMWDAHERPGDDVAITDISSAYWQEHLFEARRPRQLKTVTPPAIVALRGIDVSSHQGTVNWPAVAGSGVAFAFSKATGGTWYRNPGFQRDWLAMQQAGMVRGAYHYAFESSGDPLPGDGPEAEAEYFVTELKRAGGVTVGDLLALDIEDGQGALGDWCLRWLKRVETLTGVHPFVYTGAWFSDPHGFPSTPALADYPLWLAQYQAAVPPSPKPWSGPPVIWQNSASGSVPGVVGNVDTNLFSGTRDELLAYGYGGRSGEWTLPNPDVGSGILAMMAEDGTAPATHSTFLPLGRAPAYVEQCLSLDGTLYSWHLPTGRHWRHKAV